MNLVEQTKGSRGCLCHTDCLRLIAVGLLILSSTAYFALADCTSTPTGLIGWWPGDGNATNFFGTSNGTLQGGATASAPGMVGQAFSFDGTNGYVQIPNSTILQPTNLTIECWVKFSALDSAGSSPAGDQYIVFKQNTRSTDFEGFDLSKMRQGGGDYFRFLIASASGQTALLRSTTAISTGVWYHVAAARGFNFTQLYVNGVLERQTNVTFAQNYGNFPLYFGTSGQPAWDHKLKGSLDEVSIYNRALSSNEIAAIYSAGAAGRCKTPTITAHPVSQSVLPGTNVILSITTSGFGLLSYQWQLNGSNFPGATATTLVLSNVQPANAGDYRVIVTNSLGAATSQVATVTLLLSPTISSSPTNRRVLEATTTTFLIAATGAEPLHYQWQKGEVDLVDDVRISGSTNATLTISNLQLGDAGNYRAVVSNPYGMATSSVATLTVASNLPALSGSVGAWGDVDNDGLVDVLLAGTVQGVAGIPDGRFTRLYHSAGAGIFETLNVSLPQLDNAAAAWGDFDNDGDLDLLLSGTADGTNGSVNLTEIFRNDGSNQFTRLNAGLEGLAQGSVAWVDFNNDGLPDVFVSGAATASTNWVSRVYRNNGNGTFTLAITNLPTPPNVRSCWADYDNDGYADLLQAGSDTTYLLRNDGAGVFVNANASIPGQHHVISPWGDFDGDGDLDFMTSSYAYPSVVFGPDYHPSITRNDGGGVLTSSFNYSLDMWLFSASWGDIDNSGRACVVVSGWVPLVPGGGVWGSATKVYIYLGANWQEVFTLGGWDNRSETWVDYDGDGYLDIFTTGAGLTTFWHNNVAFHRDFPQPPLNLTNTFTALDAVTLSWQSPSNTPTTGRGLSYNVRVGHAPGGADVVSPLADVVTGRRLVQTLGNASASHVLKLNNLPPGNYYWSVQSIGQSFTGSPFAAEGVFTVTSSPPVVVTQPTNQTVFVYSNVSFAVEVIGTKPLTYQWRKDGVPLTDGANVFGTTTSTLNITNAQPTQSGGFDVVIANAYGAITSAVATLTVQSEPRMVLEPVNQYPLPTHDAGFIAAVAGALPLSYQWYFAGVPLSDGGRLSGATSSSLGIQSAQASDVGTYWLVTSNSFGSVTSAVVTLNLASTRYVNLNNGSPAAPYTNWATAAAVIQDAVDVSGPGDEIVVADGTYTTGGRAVNGTMVSRVAVDRPVTLRSVNGPAVTTIRGVGGPAASAIRCVYLTDGAGLSGFTLSGGGTRTTTGNFWDKFGGGALCASASTVISNCTITGNIAYFGGAGAYSGTLNNCVLSGNFANSASGGGGGGGAESSTLNNCTISGNGATAGGGATYSKLNNCSVTGNSASSLGQGGGAYSCMLTNCVVANNSAAGYGGGAAWSTFVGCLVTGNSAPTGGGADSGTLINCTVVANSAGSGAGVYGCTVINSIVIQNPSGGANNAAYSTFTYSCSPGLTGVGNISIDPAFVNLAAGNYRLSSASPCIDAGTNGIVAVGVDLDGRTRIEDAAVDMGAYEFHHAPFILTPPLSQSVLLQSNVLFTVTALGDEPFTYQWLKDGTNVSNGGRITGANTASLSISNLNLADGGGYGVIVTNLSGSVTSTVATLTLLGLPTISVQPVGRTVPAGTNVSFSVTASGLAAISYQWRFNGADLLAKTNSSFTLTNVQAASAGDYDVVITNIYGAVTSSVATLTVLPAAPVITTQAVSRVASVGQTIAFVVAAKGSEPITCQWQFNGTDLSGAIGFTLSLTNVNSSFNGIYRAAISNAVGFAFSTNVTLTVSPIIVWGRTNVEQISVGAPIPPTATNVIAIGGGVLTDLGVTWFALRADGSMITWGGSSTIPVEVTNVVTFSASGPNQRGPNNNLALRADGTLVHWSLASKATIPAALTNGDIVAVAAGGSHQLALRSDGTIFAWGSNTAGQTNVPPAATNVIAIAAGASHSLALRSDGTVIGWGLNTGGQATVLSNATNVIAISANGDQTLGLVAMGSAMGRTITNASPNSGYGQPPLFATNLIGIAAGFFHSLGLRSDRTVIGWGRTNSGALNVPAIVTNVFAIAAGSDNGIALVSDPFAPPIPPRIGRPPLARVLNVGDNVVFNALAVGGLPLQFQWLHNGFPLQGRTNQWLAMTNVNPADAGNYQLVAMNAFGAVTSVVASVSVNIPQPALKQPLLNAANFSFTLNTISGVLYVSEFKDGLEGAWTEFDHRIGGGVAEVIINTNAFSQTRFYRVRATYPPPP